MMTDKKLGSRRRRGKLVGRLLFAGFTALALVTGTGCWASVAFREAAIPEVQQGVSQILDGLLNGAFAAVDPANTSTSSDNNDTTTQ